MSIIDALIVINESLLTITQVADFIKQIRNGEIPTEKDVDSALQQNRDFLESEIKKLKG